ncbi:Fc.00g082840.m01.CDS01 [Cosmosporella sp. VM-42]
MSNKSHNPIHESVLDLVDPEYVAYYNANLIDKPQSHHHPVAASRGSGDLIPGSGPKHPVGETIDLHIPRQGGAQTGNIDLRMFTPQGPRPSSGWPVVVYIHSGGWVLGNLDTENTICTHVCADAGCVVVTLDYRLAPEHIYPSAVEDCWDTITWVQKEGSTKHSLDLSKIVIMGSSAGANLAAIISQRATIIKGAPKFCQQVLIVPALDHTANTTNNWSYRDFEFSPGLPVEKMLWYRNHYLPDNSKWREASPLWAEDGWANLPRTLVLVGGLDVLRSEGEQYVAKLKAAGVAAELEVIPGMPHAFFAMDGVLQKSRDMLATVVNTIRLAVEE